jgi:LysM repeat protein
LSLRLLERSVQMLVGAALWVTILAVLLPGAAEAQQGTTASTKDDPNTRNTVVVDPGDSLWSISSERLGPNATPRQINKEIERIYALNRDRIGPDPNLIFPGQEFRVPAPTAEGKPVASGAERVADRSGEPVASAQPASKKAAKKSVELQLTPSRNSGVSGTATLTDVEGGVKVELNMRGLPKAGVEHINHIHGGGTCADDRAGRTAPVTIPLRPVVVKEAGMGSATTTLKGVTLNKLFGSDQSRFILVHDKTQKGQGVPPGISCADLPQWTGTGVFETLPASSGFSLPALPAPREAVPKAGSLRAEGDPLTRPTVASFASSPLFALVITLVIIVLAVCPVALLVWTLRMRERLEVRRRRSWWVEHYGKNYTRFDPFLRFEDTLRSAPGVPDEPELGPNGSAPAAGNGPNRVGIFAAARARRSTRLPRSRLAAGGVYSPKIRRHLRTASSTRRRRRVPGAFPQQRRKRRR